MRRIVMSAAALVGALALGAGATSALAADTPSQQPSIIDAVAAQLGVTPDKLREAFKNAMNQRIDAAVAAGRLTQEQADRLKQRIADAKGLGFGPGAGQRFRDHLKNVHHRFIGHGKGLDAAATYLGLSKDEIRTQLRAGKSLAELVPSGKTKAGLVAAMVAPTKERLAQLVTDKKLTQAQADKILAKVTEAVAKLVDAKRQPKS